MENKGEILNEDTLTELLKKYGNAITCICFMGGDSSPQDVVHLAAYLKQKTNFKLKTGWYSGKSNLPNNCPLQNFNYIKLGPYIEHLGGLNSTCTNQRFYRIENEKMIDITNCFLENNANQELINMKQSM
jgi:anaerobic ribonucleoside-triphosphate reductase activating protein